MDVYRHVKKNQQSNLGLLLFVRIWYSINEWICHEGLFPLVCIRRIYTLGGCFSEWKKEGAFSFGAMSVAPSVWSITSPKTFVEVAEGRVLRHRTAQLLRSHLQRIGTNSYWSVTLRKIPELCFWRNSGYFFFISLRDFEAIMRWEYATAYQRYRPRL